jgi:hypothetical protein
MNENPSPSTLMISNKWRNFQDSSTLAAPTPANQPKSECTFDQLSMGEVMLRLDPGEGRIRTARHF